MTETQANTAKADAFKLTNSIVELSKMLSERIWADESIDEKNALAALADSIHAAAGELHDLAQAL